MSEKVEVINSRVSDAMLINMGGGVAALATTGARKGVNKPTPTSLNDKTKRGDVAPWGTNNLFPQDILKEISCSTIVKTVLNKKAMFLYGGGLVWGNVEGFDDEGNEIFKPSQGNDYRNVRDYLRKIKHQNYLVKSAQDLYFFNNLFPTFNISANRKMIANLDVYSAENCRWGWQNEKTGMLDTLYVSEHWDEISALTLKDNERVIKLTAIDPLFDPVGQVMDGNKSVYQQIYPISYPSPGCKFYQLADWDALRKGKWLSVSLKIPEFKEALMQNQMTVKYHIEIAEDYWPNNIKDWDELDQNGKISAKQQRIKDFFKIMKGEENAGNTLVTGFIRDRHDLKEYSDWKIHVIDDKLKDGAYIEDSQEASLHLLSALGVDSTLVGITPGKGIAPGSGSDKREAFNLYMSSIKAHQDLILQPFEFIRDYHVANKIPGWNADMEFRFKNSLSVTLDKGAEMQEV